MSAWFIHQSIGGVVPTWGMNNIYVWAQKTLGPDRIRRNSATFTHLFRPKTKWFTRLRSKLRRAGNGLRRRRRTKLNSSHTKTFILVPSSTIFYPLPLISRLQFKSSEEHMNPNKQKSEIKHCRYGIKA